MITPAKVRLLLAVSAVLFVLPLAQAQNFGRPAPAIREKLDDSRLVTLHNNTRPEANAANDRGRVSDDFAIEHMLLQLKASPERQAALKQYIDQLHDAGSPNFHKWLTPD